jgi:AcrR family transcriptional regulator
MPKVSQQYRDDRREQILAAARRCFVRDGFHQTSMQDLFAEAGLSSGAVYGYFAGKEEMITAIAEANLRDVVSTIHRIATEHADRPVGAVMGEVFDVIVAKHRAEGIGGLALLVWGEALRQPSLASVFSTLVEQLRGELAHVVEAQQRAGRLTADVPAESALGRARLHRPADPGRRGRRGADRRGRPGAVGVATQSVRSVSS